MSLLSSSGPNQMRVEPCTDGQRRRASLEEGTSAKIEASVSAVVLP